MTNLSDAQLSQLKQGLYKRRLELQDEVRDDLARSGEQRYIDLAVKVGRIGDDSVASMLVDIDTVITDRAVHELREIEASLKRLSEISFGDCADCGGEIGFARLLAYPTAQRCTPCQDRHEKTFRHDSTPSL